MFDLGISTTSPTSVFCDNESAIKLAHNPAFHARTKHIELHCHFIRDKIIDQVIHLLPIRTHFQLVDMFTKPLPRAKILPILSKMALKNIFHVHLEGGYWRLFIVR
jgi:hypothetical protein